MSACSRCGSFAINHHLHGRDKDHRDLCDVCYWRKRHDLIALSLTGSQARVRDLEDMLEDASVIPRQPDVEGTP